MIELSGEITMDDLRRAYREGQKYGIRRYAWTKDGTRYVGRAGNPKTLLRALQDLDEENDLDPQDKKSDECYVVYTTIGSVVSGSRFFPCYMSNDKGYLTIDEGSGCTLFNTVVGARRAVSRSLDFARKNAIRSWSRDQYLIVPVNKPSDPDKPAHHFPERSMVQCLEIGGIHA